MNRNIPAITAVMLVIALIASIFGSLIKNPTASFADEAQKTVYLTFDDGPSDRVTPKILDILNEEQIKATFFIVGKRAETRMGILKRAHDEGHSLGVHSYSHIYSEIYASKEALLDDILKCNNIIYRATGKYSNLYRFPGGSFGVEPELIDAVKERGYKCIDWNASFRDCEIKGASSEQLFNEAIATSAGANNIILLAHDATDKVETVSAVKELIKRFKALGYKFDKL